MFACVHVCMQVHAQVHVQESTLMNILALVSSINNHVLKMVLTC